MQDWKRLQTHRGVLLVAEHSSLKHCVAPSIRQNNHVHQVPLSRKVIAYALWGLIGAVFLDSSRNLEETCHTINALCGYLNQDVSADTNSRIPTSAMPSGLEDIFSPGRADDDSQMDVDEQHLNSIVPSLPDSSVYEGWTGNDPVSEDRTAVSVLIRQHLSMPTTTPHHDSQNRTNEQTLSQVLYGDLVPNHEFPDHSLDLHGISVAHASFLGQQQFFMTTSQAIEHSVPVTKTKTKTKTKKVKERSDMHQKIDDYVEGQNKQYQSLPSSTHFPVSLTLTNIVEIRSEDPKHQATMRKLFHGTISASSVINIKNALTARRSAHVIKASPAIDSPVFYYRMVEFLSDSRAQNTVETYYHIYMLYISLRGEFRSHLDDGFLHSNQQNLNPLSAEPAATIGNPINKNLSKEYRNMLYRAVDDFEWKTEDEQERLIRSIDRLRKLGTRLYRFVRKFGIGVLCLLLFKDAKHDEHVLSISEAE